MEMSKFVKAKSSFLMMVFGALLALVQSFLPSNSPLGSILSLVSFFLILIALWKLRPVEDGYRNAFMVEVVALIFSVAGVGLTSWAIFSGQAAMAAVIVVLIALVPMLLGAVLQYFFCTATGRVMRELGAENEAVWSGWMWKLYGASAIFGILVSVLPLMGQTPALLVDLLRWVSLLVGVIQVVYYFFCYRALPAE